MDELEIDGKKYLSSRRAAKEHKYHIDYIGQLIRAGKVAGKKVGRSWYVEAASLKSYLSQEREAAPASAPAPEPIVTESAPAERVQPVQPAEPAQPIIEPTVQETPAVLAVAQHLEAEIPAPSVPHISARISEEGQPVSFTTAAPVERRQNTVTYIEEDTEPMLPPLNGRVRANADFIPVPLRKVVEPPQAQESAPERFMPQSFALQKTKKNRRASLTRTGLIALAALAAFALTAAGSAMLATSISVSEGQAASVGLVFN